MDLNFEMESKSEGKDDRNGDYFVVELVKFTNTSNYVEKVKYPPIYVGAHHNVQSHLILTTRDMICVTDFSSTLLK